MIKVLFVCMGNICRSPSGEGVFGSIVEAEGLSGLFKIDSAGTTAYHLGERADARMRKHASRRGIELLSRARQFGRSDFGNFDYIIAMDADNLRDIRSMDRRGEYGDRIFLMNDFSKERRGSDVPDPYYGGDAGFELVLDMLEDSCRGLFEYIKEKHGV